MEHRSLDRIRRLADPGSWVPWHPVEGAGYHLGRAMVSGRPVWLFVADVDRPMQVSPMAGMSRQVRFIQSILSDPAPLVLVLDIPAHLKQMQGKTPIPTDAMHLLADAYGMGGLYASLGRLAWVVPRVALVFGTIGAAFSFPACLCDATVMLSDAAMCIGRPDAVGHMIGQQTSFNELGGPAVHFTKTGMAHAVTQTEAGALTWARRWLGYWPARAGDCLPCIDAQPPDGDIMAVGERISACRLNQSYDMRALIRAVMDRGSLLEMGGEYGGECMTILCRINGRPTGLLASDPQVRGGILFPATCRKMTRFVRLCDRFGLPLVFLADTPGFMIGKQVEHDGAVQAGADLYTAIAQCRSAKVCVVVGKAYSAGLFAMAGGGGFGARFWALPTASVSVFGPEALERFSHDRQMSPSAREALESMLAGALDVSCYEQQHLVERVLDWSALRPSLVDLTASEQELSK